MIPLTANFVSESKTRPLERRVETRSHLRHYNTNTTHAHKLLTILLGKLLGLLVRHVPLSLQVGLVANQNDHLDRKIDTERSDYSHLILVEASALCIMVVSLYRFRESHVGCLGFFPVKQ